MTADKKNTFEKLKGAKEIYVLMSDCTKMPFVLCDSETYDDEVLLFYTEEEAKTEGKKLVDANHPIRILKIVNQYFLSFFSSLFPMGVNCLIIGKGTKEEIRIQLNELIRRPDNSGKSSGEKLIENPEFLLTAIYLMQNLRGKKKDIPVQEIKDLEEEMMAHYGKGKYLIALNPDKQIPVLKKEDGQILQPLFTDVQEFLKFQNMNKKIKYTIGTVEAKKVPDMLSKETTGIVLNPMGINMQLNIVRKE